VTQLADHDQAPLLIDEQGGVAWLTMNRPERLNAMNPALVDALCHYFEALRDRSDIRVVVLQGAGRAYCAGLDLKHQASEATASVAKAGEPRPLADSFATQYSIRNIMLAMRRCPQPVISVVQGSASGGGLALALSSDIRLATPEARFNAAFIKIGLTGCDMGVSYFLPRMVGASVAAEMLMTGRFMNAQRAYQLGLVSHVAPLDELLQEAKALVQELLSATPLGLRLTKEALGHAIDGNSLESVMAMEDRNQMLATRGSDFHEGMTAFLEKRPPRYTGA
jgi:enoyl-CoA hydratase/carnithine racemase